MALTPGNRYRISDLPVTQLGFSYWDGWFLGAQETHDGERSLFTLYFEPTLARTAIADTDRFMAGGELTLSANINSSVTSMSVATTGSKLATTDLPYTLLLDSEQVTVTACTGATPQVATITRGVNGTTAAAHTTTAVIESTPDALFAY